MKFINYVTDVSQKYIDYPFYHPNRPRFFNNANLFQETTDSLIEGINDYVLQKWNIEIKFYPNLAYENYVNWENSGGKELKLPGFFLTNRQMYWVALAHTTYFKFHSHSAEYKMKYDYLFQYYQLQFKNNHYFREDFNCSKIDEDEEKTMKG